MFKFVGSQSLTIFARSRTWISPLMGSDTQKVDSKGTSPSRHEKYHYTESEKKRSCEDVLFFLNYRKHVETNIAKAFPLFLRRTPLKLYAKKAMSQRMLNIIGPGHEELKANIIPTWSPGCRRLTIGVPLKRIKIAEH